MTAVVVVVVVLFQNENKTCNQKTWVNHKFLPYELYDLG